MFGAVSVFGVLFYSGGAYFLDDILRHLNKGFGVCVTFVVVFFGPRVTIDAYRANSFLGWSRSSTTFCWTGETSSSTCLTAPRRNWTRLSRRCDTCVTSVLAGGRCGVVDRGGSGSSGEMVCER